MKVSTLTALILQINSAIDSGKHNSISIADIHGAIDKRSLLKFLNTACKGDIDLSMYLPGGIDGFEAFMRPQLEGFTTVMQEMNVVSGAFRIRVFALHWLGRMKSFSSL